MKMETLELMRHGRVWDIFWNDSKQKWVVKSEVWDEIYEYQRRASAYKQFCELEGHTMRKRI